MVKYVFDLRLFIYYHGYIRICISNAIYIYKTRFENRYERYSKSMHQIIS